MDFMASMAVEGAKTYVGLAGLSLNPVSGASWGRKFDKSLDVSEPQAPT